MWQKYIKYLSLAIGLFISHGETTKQTLSQKCPHGQLIEFVENGLVVLTKTPKWPGYLSVSLWYDFKEANYKEANSQACPSSFRGLL